MGGAFVHASESMHSLLKARGDQRSSSASDSLNPPTPTTPRAAPPHLSAMSSTAPISAARALGVSFASVPSGSSSRSQRSRTHSAAPLTRRTLPPPVAAAVVGLVARWGCGGAGLAYTIGGRTPDGVLFLNLGRDQNNPAPHQNCCSPTKVPPPPNRAYNQPAPKPTAPKPLQPRLADAPEWRVTRPPLVAGAGAPPCLQITLMLLRSRSNSSSARRVRRPL